jgi:hypothetical protein
LGAKLDHLSDEKIVAGFELQVKPPTLSPENGGEGKGGERIKKEISIQSSLRLRVGNYNSFLNFETFNFKLFL